MRNFPIKELKNRSEAIVSQYSGSIRNLVLIYTGVIVVLSLLSNGITLLLDYGIDSTGGLSGLGTRSILETAQTVLQYATGFFSPFWQMSFYYVAIHLARQIAGSPKDLLSSFRRAGRILGYYMLQLSLIFLCGMVCSYIASFIFTLTPFADPLLEVLDPILASGTLDMDAIPIEQMMEAYVPFLIIMLALFLPLYIFLSYCIRLTPYFIMDDPSASAFFALRLSFAGMRGRKIAMLKLDFSYWWYYAIEILLTVVCYLDILLPMLGIPLPIDATLAFFLTLLLYGVLEMAFKLWLNGRVDITYALVYTDIRQELMN